MMQMVRPRLLSKIVLTIAVVTCSLLSQMGEDFAYYRLGIKYKKEKKYDKAIESFRKVLAVYPDNYNSYYQIAEIRIEQGKLGLAAYELKKALEYRPNWPDAQYLLAKCYEENKNVEKALIEWRRFTQISKDEKRNAQAEEHIKRLLAKIRKEELKQPEVVEEIKKSMQDDQKVKPVVFTDQAYSDPDYLKGVDAYNKKQYKKALQHFRTAIQKTPGHPGAYYYAGVIRYRQKQLQMAEINFRKSFNFKPLGFNAYYYLGLIYEDQRKIDPAIGQFRTYKKLTQSATGKREAQQHIDWLLAMKGKVPAKASPAMATQARPLPPKPFVYRIDDLLAFMIEDTTLGDGRVMMDAIHLFREGKYDAAMKKFKTVELRNPKGVLADDAVYNTGICYMKLRLYDNAQNKFDQLSTVYPDSKLIPRAEYLKGIAELEKDEFANAEKIFRKWIRAFPKDRLLPHAYARLGDALAKQGLIKDGIDAYRASLPFFEEDKQKLPVLFAIGENYQNLDLQAKAADYFEETVKVGKGVGSSVYVQDAFLKLGDYHYNEKRYDKAKHYYEVMVGSYPNSGDMPWAKFQIGNIYRAKLLYDSAIDAYREVIRNYPDSYWAKQAQWKLEDTVWQNEYREVLQ